MSKQGKRRKKRRKKKKKKSIFKQQTNMQFFFSLLDLKYIIDTISTNQVSEFEPGLVRNASVAAIIRWRPYITDHILSYPLPPTPAEFLNQSWINDCHGEAEILFIQRASHPTDM